ncbi:MAG: response regulator [Candidatus Acidiferrales bacterium]
MVPKTVDKTSRILIVDDDQALRQVLREHLENNYEIIDTGDPESALAMTLEHKPDLILLDLMMPNLSGFELCQTIASLSFTQNIPIFIVSGYDNESYRTYCQKLGAAEYFEKPIDLARLKACLANTLSAKIKERRTSVRLRLRVSLKMQGIDQQGKPQEETSTTEDFSATGFQCRCKGVWRFGSTVEVFLQTATDQYVGSARIVWIEAAESPFPLHGFCFVKRVGEWVVN